MAERCIFRMVRSFGAGALALALVLPPGLAQAQASAAAPPPKDEHRLQWHPKWRRVGPPEYVATALLGAGIVGLHWVGSAKDELWTGPILHDEWMRDRLRVESRTGRSRASTWSDALDLGLMAHLFVVDNLLVTAALDSNPDVAWQMFVINLQSYAASTFVNRVTKRLTRRARPYVERCRDDPEADDRCSEKSSYHSSFYSGHATSTATSAGLICAHHTHLALYGGGLPDVATCVAAIGATTATGALRIASDNHWATDVLVGHVSGYLAGYLLPTLLYYREPRAAPIEETGSRVRLTGFVLPRGDGAEIGLGGIF